MSATLISENGVRIVQQTEAGNGRKLRAVQRYYIHNGDKRSPITRPVVDAILRLLGEEDGRQDD